MKTTISKEVLKKLRAKVEYSYTVKWRLAEARTRIKELEKRLQIETRLNRALSKMVFSREQPPAVVAEVKRLMKEKEAA